MLSTYFGESPDIVTKKEIKIEELAIDQKEIQDEKP